MRTPGKRPIRRRTYDLWANAMAKKWGISRTEFNSHPYDYVSYYNDNPDQAWEHIDNKLAPYQHFPDRYKTAGHPTFSNLSVYTKKFGIRNPKGIEGGTWNDSGDAYTLSPDQVSAGWDIDNTAKHLAGEDVTVYSPHGKTLVKPRFNSYARGKDDPFKTGELWNINGSQYYELNNQMYNSSGSRVQFGAGTEENPTPIAGGPAVVTPSRRQRLDHPFLTGGAVNKSINDRLTEELNYDALARRYAVRNTTPDLETLDAITGGKGKWIAMGLAGAGTASALPYFAPGGAFWMAPATKLLAASTLGGMSVDAASRFATGKPWSEMVRGGIRDLTGLEMHGPAGELLYDMTNPGYLLSYGKLYNAITGMGRQKAIYPITGGKLLTQSSPESATIEQNTARSQTAAPAHTNAAEPYTILHLPGYQLKSLMRGNKLEKLMSKSGTIGVLNIRLYMKNASNIENVIVDKILSREQFAGQKAVDYNAFRKAVQDELIPPYTRVPLLRHERYGIERLGFDELVDESFGARNIGFVLEHRYPTRFKRTIAGFNEELNPIYSLIDTETGARLTTNEDMYNYIPLLNKELPKTNTFTFESPRIPIGNSRHYDHGTLGHSRTFTTAEEPDILHVMESQSDWAQNRPTSSLDIRGIKNILDLEEEIAIQRAGMDQGSVGEGWENELDWLEAARYYLDPETSHLAANFERRQLQENMRYAAEHGQTRMRYPTPETAAKVEGYSKVHHADIDPEVRQAYKSRVHEAYAEAALYGDPYTLYSQGHPAAVKWNKLNEEWQKYLKEHTVEDYAPLNKTILKKYADFPKLFRKLYKDAEVRTITDAKGNTWYEVDVPENYLNQEWQYGALPWFIGGAGVAAAYGGMNNSNYQ